MQQENLSISNSNSNNLNNNNLKFILRIVIYLAIMFPIYLYTSKLYAEATTYNIANAPVRQRYDEFFSLDNNTLDMVFIGSSHSYCTFDPEVFDEKLGTSSFQLGTPTQHPNATYFLLREIFEKQSPKVVVMELYWDLLKNDFNSTQNSFFFDAINFEALNYDELKQEYINTTFPLNEKVKYVIEPIKYQQDYFLYKSSKLEDSFYYRFGVTKKVNPPREGIEKYNSKGYVYSEYLMLESEFNTTNQFRNLDGKSLEFSNTQKYYLDLIVELVEENNAEIIFVTAPVAPVSLEFIKNYDDINNTVFENIKEYNKPYIDYNIEYLENRLPVTHDNFQDDAHLNTSGAIIVSELFIDYLIEVSPYIQNINK